MTSGPLVDFSMSFLGKSFMKYFCFSLPSDLFSNWTLLLMFPLCKLINREGERLLRVCGKGQAIKRIGKQEKVEKFEVYDITAAVGNAGALYLHQ